MLLDAREAGAVRGTGPRAVAPTRYAEDLSHEDYANLRARLIEQILALREALGE